MDEIGSVPFRVRVKRDNFAGWLCSCFLLLLHSHAILASRGEILVAQGFNPALKCDIKGGFGDIFE